MQIKKSRLLQIIKEELARYSAGASHASHESLEEALLNEITDQEMVDEFDHYTLTTGDEGNDTWSKLNITSIDDLKAAREEYRGKTMRSVPKGSEPPKDPGSLEAAIADTERKEKAKAKSAAKWAEKNKELNDLAIKAKEDPAALKELANYFTDVTGVNDRMVKLVASKTKGGRSLARQSIAASFRKMPAGEGEEVIKDIASILRGKLQKFVDNFNPEEGNFISPLHAAATNALLDYFDKGGKKSGSDPMSAQPRKGSEAEGFETYDELINRLYDEADKGFEILSPGFPDPLQLLLKKETTEKVRNILNTLLKDGSLTPRRYYIIEQYFLEGKTQQQIADEIGITQEAVNGNIKTFKTKFAKKFKNFK